MSLRESTANGLLLPVLAVGAALTAAADVERTCPGAPGVGVIELWPAASIPANGLRFDLARGIGGAVTPTDTRPANGLPNSAAVAVQCSITNSTDLPIQQSFARAAAAWSNATMPGGTQPATSFAIDPVMTRATGYPDYMTWNQMPIQSSPFLASGPSIQLVTFWEHPNVWNLFGSTALGIAAVDLVPGTGIIRDADIAMNAMSSGVGGRPLFRFVEDNAALGTTITTLGFNESPSATLGLDPIVGYVDIEGVLAHELGHAAGLAHSLIDGPTSQTASSTPTMFAIAQVQPYTGNIAFPLQGCTGHVTTQANGAATQFGGIVGVPARTLESDDVASISVAYPGPGQASLGSITGQVVDASGAAVRGAHVVAVNQANPEGIRVGTFSDSSGAYTIGSLPAGQYLVLVEAPDINGYFAGTGLPEFIDPAFNCGGPPVFEMEMLDLADSASEALQMEASLYAVSAGQATSVNNCVVEAVAGPRLVTRACFDNALGTQVCGPDSTRGSVHNNLASPGAVVDLQLVGGTPGGLGAFNIGVDRLYGFLFGQVIETNPLPGGSATLTLDAAGSATLSLPVNGTLVGTTFYGQAADFDPATSTLRFTNSVTLRLDAR